MFLGDLGKGLQKKWRLNIRPKKPTKANVRNDDQGQNLAGMLRMNIYCA